MRFVRWIFRLTVTALWVAGCPVIAQETDGYTYDALGRLVAVVKTGGAANGQASTIAYDPAGNRTNYAINGAATAPTISIAGASANEGSSLTFAATRAGSTTSAISAAWATSDGSGVAGTNYTASGGTVNFAAGATTATILVPTIDDHVVTSNLTMTITLSSPSPGAGLGTPTSATGTIVNVDAAPSSTLSIGTAGAQEGHFLSFPVTRSGSPAAAVSAQWATSNNTAIAGTNYTAASGTISIAAGATTGTITITTLDDCVVTSTKTMYVTLSSPSSGVVIGTSRGVGTITNLDKINCN